MNARIEAERKKVAERYEEIKAQAEAERKEASAAMARSMQLMSDQNKQLFLLMEKSNAMAVRYLVCIYSGHIVLYSVLWCLFRQCTPSSLNDKGYLVLHLARHNKFVDRVTHC